MSKLTQYFWNSLPEYFPLYDTYKSERIPQGILERYLSCMQAEGDVSVTDIEGMVKLPFPETTPDKHLSFIAGLYGYPPDTMGNVDLYRRLLRNIIDINKVKGTLEGFKKFFAIMDIELEDTDIDVRRLSEVNYDDPAIFYDKTNLYDSSCFPCVTINVNIPDDPHKLFEPASGSVPPSGYHINQKLGIQSILYYLFPVNALMGVYKYRGGDPLTIKIPPTHPYNKNLLKFKT